MNFSIKNAIQQIFNAHQQCVCRLVTRLVLEDSITSENTDRSYL